MRPLLLAIFLPSLAFSQDPTPRDFQAQLAKLTPEATTAERVAVARWIAAKGRSEHSALAADAMEKLIAEDKESEVRRAAIAARFQIARQKKEPCPLSIVRALRDPVDEVRWEASMWAAIFKTNYAEGSLKLLIDALTDERPEVRSHCVSHLGFAAGKNAMALEAIEKAKKDKVFDVRQSAHSAAFRATDNLHDYLRYLIQLREEPEPLLDSFPAGSEEAKIQSTQRNLLSLGSAFSLIAWSEDRPKELAKVLTKFLDDKSPIIRRGAAGMIGATARRVERTQSELPRPFEALLPYVEGGPFAKPKSRKEPPPTPLPSPAYTHFRELKTTRLLAYLSTMDPDAGVRVRAGEALTRIAELAEPLSVPPREIKP